MFNRPFSNHPTRRDRSAEHAFRCVQCRQLVSCDPLVAGVRNRNHCPACLWSRHLDWRVPGDRRSNCRAPMQPIGLAARRRANRYGGSAAGELMLIHRCTGCDAIVLNRIAADDSPAVIFEVFDAAQAAVAALRTALAASPIAQLPSREYVRRCLFGDSAPGWRDMTTPHVF